MTIELDLKEQKTAPAKGMMPLPEPSPLRIVKAIDLTSYMDLTESYNGLPDKITSDGSLKLQSEFVLGIASETKEIDNLRLSSTLEYRNITSAINKLFEPYINDLAEMTTVVKRRINIYLQERERKEREEQEKLAAERRKEMERLEKEREAELKDNPFADTAPPIEAPPPPPPPQAKAVETDAGRISTRKRLTFRFTDESKVPREYCVPERKLIMAAGSKGVIVPGVEFYYESDVVAGGRR